MEHRFPRVVVTKGLLVAIHDYICDFIQQKGPNLEIGGMLVGEFEAASKDALPLVRLQGFIDAGPKTDCRPGSILMDSEYQGHMLQALRLQHPRSDVQGMFHLHPGNYDECSSGDYEADRQALASAGTGTLVFIIVTRDNPKHDPLSLRLGKLKFDCFVLSRQLGQRYHKVLPVLEEGALLQPEPLLARWMEIKGPQVRADWTLLQQIPGLKPFSLREVVNDGRRDLWLTSPAPEPPRAIHVLLRQDGGLRLFLGTEQTLEQECQGPWTAPDIGQHIFVSQLLLLALERLDGNATAAPLGRHFASLIQDKHRLVAEVRAMRERFGDEPQLRREGDRLFWRCTVCQSGRQFPVAIHYPPTYPHEPPEIRCLATLKAGCPHLLSQNTLCWIDFYGHHSEWNPGRDTAASALVAIHRWFACYLVWLTLGHWPESANH